MDRPDDREINSTEDKVRIEREKYLKEFEIANDLNEMKFPNGNEIGEDVVSLLKQKSLTYEEAYMGLQYAYNKLRYETNFLKLK